MYISRILHVHCTCISQTVHMSKSTYTLKPELSGEQIRAPSMTFFNRSLTLSSTFFGKSGCISTPIQAFRKLREYKKLHSSCRYALCMYTHCKSQRDEEKGIIALKTT